VTKQPLPAEEGKRRRRRTPRQWKPPKLKCFPITVSRQLPVVWLQDNYGVQEDGVTRISGRTPEGKARKGRFQGDGLLYANALGQALAVYGRFTEQRVTCNRGHPQDPGSIMASYYRPHHPYWLSVYIESNPGKTAVPRPDGVIILACRRRDAQDGERERIHSLNPAMSSRELAMILLLLVGLKKAEDLDNEHFLAREACVRSPTLFGTVPEERVPPPQASAEAHGVVRVWLLGAYRQCLLLRPGKTSVQTTCTDVHPRMALSYWGKQSTQPIARVHPDDRPLCAVYAPSQLPVAGQTNETELQ
jgi:hypothetical protein